jgi:hypothetical protein
VFPPGTLGECAGAEQACGGTELRARLRKMDGGAAKPWRERTCRARRENPPIRMYAWNASLLVESRSELTRLRFLLSRARCRPTALRFSGFGPHAQSMNAF